jgi:hypothetical protein
MSDGRIEGRTYVTHRPLNLVPSGGWVYLGIYLTGSTLPEITTKLRLQEWFVAMFKLQLHNLPHLLCGLTRPVAAITEVCGSAAAFPSLISFRTQPIKKR